MFIWKAERIDLFSLLVHSPQVPGTGRSWESHPGLAHGCCWAITCCLPRHVNRKLDRKQSCQGWNWHSIRDAAIADGSLIWCATTSAPLLRIPLKTKYWNEWVWLLPPLSLPSDRGVIIFDYPKYRFVLEDKEDNSTVNRIKVKAMITSGFIKVPWAARRDNELPWPAVTVKVLICVCFFQGKQSAGGSS